MRDSTGGLIQSNDNWRSDQEAEIIATTIPPSNDLESAIVATLPANSSAYTATVRGVNNGTGIGVVEAYDLNRAVNSKLANISTRGLVQTGDNVLIGGLIVLGQNPLRVIVRAIGPSLPVAGSLADPTLELRDGNGGLVAANDNWRSDHEAGNHCDDNPAVERSGVGDCAKSHAGQLHRHRSRREQHDRCGSGRSVQLELNRVSRQSRIVRAAGAFSSWLFSAECLTFSSTRRSAPALSQREIVRL